MAKARPRPKPKAKAKKTAKRKASPPPISRGPDAREMRRYQAESLVSDAMKATPAFKRAVAKTEKALESAAITATKALVKEKT